MILFNKGNNTFYLETEKTSYIMRILDNNCLYHCYYGNKIACDDMGYYNLFHSVGFSQNGPVEGKEASIDVLPQECPTRGRGDYRTPAVVVKNELGRIVNELKYKSYQIVDGKPAFPEMPQLDAVKEDCQTLEITLEDSANGYEVVL